MDKTTQTRQFIEMMEAAFAMPQSNEDARNTFFENAVKIMNTFERKSVPIALHKVFGELRLYMAKKDETTSQLFLAFMAYKDEAARHAQIYPDDFSTYPVSLNASRPNDNAAEWTPREAIIDVLRTIDSHPDKDQIDAAVVVYRFKSGKGKTRTRFSNAAPDIGVTLGMLELAKMMLFRDGE